MGQVLERQAQLDRHRGFVVGRLRWTRRPAAESALQLHELGVAVGRRDGANEFDPRGRECERLVGGSQPGLTVHRRFAAISASSLRSPLERRMCPASFSFLKRSATIVRPLDALSTYGLSIWKGSPVSTIFVPSPQRVMIVFTSCGERFCASSTRRYWRGMLRR